MTNPVYQAQLVAALACTEYCDLIVGDGRVELSARREPSEALERAFVRAHGAIVGLLGWGLPLEWAQGSPRPRWASVQWRSRGMGNVGRWGRN